jgi:hypothetical protein
MGWAAVALAVAALGTLVAFDWTSYGEFPYDERLYKTSQTLQNVSIGFAAVALLLSRGTPWDGRGTTVPMWLTLAATAGLVALLSAATIGEVSDEYFWRVTAIVATLWALGISVVGILPRTRAG